MLALYRGYANQGFEAWTIPCLYVGGRYLRIFAIKADSERNSSSVNDNTETFQDDFDPESEKSQQQEDCARQLNRLFQLCLSDRYGRRERMCSVDVPYAYHTFQESGPRDLTEVGNLRHHQLAVQDLLSTQFG